MVFIEHEGGGWDDDLAVLDLVGDLSSELVPLRLARASDVWRHRYRAYGFPAGPMACGLPAGS